MTPAPLTRITRIMPMSVLLFEGRWGLATALGIGPRDGD